MIGSHAPLAGRRITVGVTGSIAAYKAVLLVRLLLKDGATVRVVMTAGAQRFVGANTFAGLTGEPVLTEMFDESVGGERHVALGAESDVIVVAPATADVLARFAGGRADDLLTATVLCATCPVLVVPAMHPSMWGHPATVDNVRRLSASERVEFIGPAHGEVASGDRGLGRMVEPEGILERVRARSAPRDLEGRHVVVTAGPTVEDLDPVRFLGNRSSGKMGFALAKLARERGAHVTLIAGPVSLDTPANVMRVNVRSAVEMQKAVRGALGKNSENADVLLMAAAVGDFRPKQAFEKKFKREGRDTLSLELVQNPDILAEIGAARRGKKPLLVGFAVETGTDAEIVRYARKKLASKRVDVVIANHAAESMGRDDNRVLIVDAKSVDSLDAMPKHAVAARILDWVVRHTSVSAPPLAPSSRGKKQKSKTKQ